MTKGKQMSLTKIIESLATIGTLVGLYLISEGNANGFTVGGISNILWMAYANEEKQTGIMIVNAILLLINLNGLGII